MRTIAARSSYLSGSVRPLIRATLRRLRLDFGSELFYKNDEQVIDSPAYQGDDYNDQSGGNALIWGDSCITASNGYQFRIVAKSAWTAGGSTSMWRGGPNSGELSSQWQLKALTAAFTPHEYCRVGVYPKSGSDNVYVWYVSNADHKVKRVELNTASFTWGSPTSGVAVLASDSYAVHPISESTAVVVGFYNEFLWVRVCTTSSAGDQWVVMNGGDLVWGDAHWSDAVVSPDDSSKYVVALNLSRWGSAHTVIYDSDAETWSQPREILPSAQDWGNLKVRVSGMSIIDTRIWAVTVREPVASDDVQMAHHVALASSTDGIHWTDEYFCTQSTLRGKLLYNETDDYCYVVGNVSVARAEATNRLGYDPVSLKHSVVETHGLRYTHSGVGSAPEINLEASNDSDSLSGSGLLEADSELSVEIGAEGESYSDYGKVLLTQPKRDEQWDDDKVLLTGLGYSGRLLGAQSYRPVAAKNYQNPYSLYTDFTSDRGLAKISVRQVTGTWTTEWLWELGRHALHCTSAGIALVPYELQTQSFIARMRFKAEVSLEGNFIVFWYEDEENYWRAGIYLDGSTHKLVIQRVEGGTLLSRSEQSLSGVDRGTWYTVYVDARPDQIRAFCRLDGTFDYYSATYYDTSYSAINVTGVPARHHIGLECEGYQGFEGSVSNGTVTAATINTITDGSASFDSSVVGKWLRCKDQDRQIVDYTTTTLTVRYPWADTPNPGNEYGIYTDESVGGPKMYVNELFVCEARVPWTVDDIVDNIFALAGVERDAVYPSTSVPTLGSASPVAWDVDLRISAAYGTGAEFWCSSTTDSGTTAYSGMLVYTSTDTVFLQQKEGSGGGTPAQNTVREESHPALVDSAGPGVSAEYRIQAGRDVIVVSMGDHFITAFPTKGAQTGGYMGRYGSGSARTTEFPEMMDLIWDANETAGGALRRLMQGRRAKVLERKDGTVAISRFDTGLRDDLGTYSTPLISRVTKDDIGERYALVEMVGAEERAFYLDPGAARYRLNFARADNPVLNTQYQALMEAKRLAELGRQKATAIEASLYIVDPAAELEDEFTIGTTDYIVDGLSFSIKLDKEGRPRATAKVAGREAPESVTTGTYGSIAYDDGKAYGG